MADENTEPEVEMVNQVVEDEPEETEEVVEEPVEVEEDAPEVVEPVEKPKRPVRRKKAPVMPVVEITGEDAAEEVQEEPEEAEEDETEVEDLGAVLSRLKAIEALLSNTPETEETEGASDFEARAVKAERDLVALRVGYRYELPEELIEVLKGDTEEAIEAHAKKLAGASGSGRGSLGTGGLDPTEDTFDAKAFVRDNRKKNNGGL